MTVKGDNGWLVFHNPSDQQTGMILCADISAIYQNDNTGITNVHIATGGSYRIEADYDDVRHIVLAHRDTGRSLAVMEEIVADQAKRIEQLERRNKALNGGEDQE